MRKFRTQKARRRQRAKITLLSVVAFALLTGALLGIAWLSQLPRFQVTEIAVEGNGAVAADDIVAEVRAALAGRRFALLARSNIWFVPERRIKKRVLEAFPRIEEIEVSPRRPHTLAVRVAERTPHALWCGDVVPQAAAWSSASASSTALVPQGTCYFTDDDGVIFARAPRYTGSPLARLYGAIDSGEEIGARVLPAAEYRRMHDLLAQLVEGGMRPQALLIVDDVDYELYLSGGTRVLFSRDQRVEQVRDHLFSLAASEAMGELTAAQYIDLRFGNKVFIKE